MTPTLAQQRARMAEIAALNQVERRHIRRRLLDMEEMALVRAEHDRARVGAIARRCEQARREVERDNEQLRGEAS